MGALTIFNEHQLLLAFKVRQESWAKWISRSASGNLSQEQMYNVTTILSAILLKAWLMLNKSFEHEPLPFAARINPS